MRQRSASHTTGVDDVSYTHSSLFSQDHFDHPFIFRIFLVTWLLHLQRFRFLKPGLCHNELLQNRLITRRRHRLLYGPTYHIVTSTNTYLVYYVLYKLLTLVCLCRALLPFPPHSFVISPQPSLLGLLPPS
jgi:hypothetical protein